MSRKLDVAALAAKAETGNNSSVRRIETLNMNLGDLLLEEPFKSFFPIRDDIKNAIKSHMLEHGYDDSKPIDVWKRSSQDGFEYVLVDGFTRVTAAKEIGKLTVTAYLHNFVDADEAQAYAIHTQRDRRNMTDAEIMSALSVIDKKVTGGGNGELPIITAQRTAKEIGTSARKIERARKVASDPEMAAAVKRGEISINRGYNEIRAKEKQASEPSGAEAPSLYDQEEQAEMIGEEGANKNPIEISSIAERVRANLGVEVKLSVEESGESGQISLCFMNHGQLDELVNYLSAPRIPR
jgi:ParB-like chromosome segregation protein Spo0J